jgi:FKBP-type peptidyl-prolyl cis-trans isomerase SlyD
MKIDTNTVVSLKYKLSDNQTGEKIEETTPDHPMEFLYGVERIIPTFEENIHGLDKGAIFDFTIPSADAYGERSEDQVATIPISVFHNEEGQINENDIFVGALLPMTDGEGNQLRGRIMDITPEMVRMDFNHPLAGTDLHFQGEVLDVRPATDEELSHGHSHGAHGHHH